MSHFDTKWQSDHTHKATIRCSTQSDGGFYNDFDSDYIEVYPPSTGTIMPVT